LSVDERSDTNSLPARMTFIFSAAIVPTLAIPAILVWLPESMTVPSVSLRFSLSLLYSLLLSVAFLLLFILLLLLFITQVLVFYSYSLGSELRLPFGSTHMVIVDATCIAIKPNKIHQLNIITSGAWGIIRRVRTP
jgi:hypothetical protein